jgi:hypothetical protein
MSSVTAVFLGSIDFQVVSVDDFPRVCLGYFGQQLIGCGAPEELVVEDQ